MLEGPRKMEEEDEEREDEELKVETMEEWRKTRSGLGGGGGPEGNRPVTPSYFKF